MTTQIAVIVPDDVLSSIDKLVDDGLYANRSAAVRAGLVMVSEQPRSHLIDQAFKEGFRRMAETSEELEESRRLAIEAIETEPWKPWW